MSSLAGDRGMPPPPRLPMRGTSGSHTLVDILDRILDKGLVVAGDVKVSLADVELLTIRIRLVICSVDKAQQIGLDWWRTDPAFGSLGASEAPALRAERSQRLAERVERLDAKLDALLAERAELPGPTEAKARGKAKVGSKATRTTRTKQEPGETKGKRRKRRS